MSDPVKRMFQVYIPHSLVRSVRVLAAQNDSNASQVAGLAIKIYLYLHENHPDDLAALLADMEAQLTESEAA